MACLILLAAGVAGSWRGAPCQVSKRSLKRRERYQGAPLKKGPCEHEGDEIDQLAITFNEMLDRIQTF